MKQMKNLVCLLLAAAMCLSLAACGSSGSSPAATATPDASSAPEYVYVSNYKSLVDHSKDYVSVRSYSDEGLYYSVWE